MPRTTHTRLAAAALCALALTPATAKAQTREPSTDRPSILLIVTDDQRWDTLWAMPETGRLLAEPGVTFANAITTSPLCCPSRATILTGAYPHSTGVYTQTPPHGGFEGFDDRTTIATQLDAAGYRTGFFGKYLDAYQADALAGYVPPGWDRWVAFVHAEYLDYGLTVDGRIRRYGHEPSDYSTDVLAEKAEAFIRNAEGPVLAMFAPAAPHAPAIPAPSDAGAFEELPAWAPPSFDEVDRSDKPAHIRARRPIGDGRRADLEVLRRDQYRSLLAVDRAVARLVGALEDTGRLDRALVILTSDNGLLWGEHRWLKKEVPYEEAIRVPLVVRADGQVGDGSRVEERLVGNVDLAPTIAEIAGVSLPGVEGRSLVPLLDGSAQGWRRALLVEHVRGANPVPTYCAVRTGRYLFVTYETGERELYDLATDPFQLANLHGTAPAIESRLETTLRGLCRPPPPGLRPQAGTAVTLMTVVGTFAAAASMSPRWPRSPVPSAGPGSRSTRRRTSIGAPSARRPGASCAAPSAQSATTRGRGSGPGPARTAGRRTVGTGAGSRAPGCRCR